MELTPKIKDYITTLALAAVPVIIAYQSQIGQHVPVEYALVFTIGMGILSQVVTNKRVQTAYTDTSVVLDEAQGKVQEYQDLVSNLQTEIDERQVLIEQVTGIREMTEEPVEGQ